MKNLIAANYREEEYPVCLAQAREWSVSRPLEGLTVLDVTPIYRNTLVKHLALLAAGAKLMVGRSALIPGDEKIVKLLEENGIKVISSDSPQSEEVDIILDCAAVFSHWKPKIGNVELTRSGVERYESSGLPVFVADSGRIKRIETSLGTGEGYFRAMKQLGYNLPAGSRIVIFGCGKVGSGILKYACINALEPILVTQLESVTDQIRALASDIIDCNDIDKVVEAVKDAYAVVSATGIKGALSHPRLSEALMNSSALIANMGVEDEFGPELPQERVLNGKQALNFILEEPTHLKYIDATMGLHNEGAIYLMEHPEARGLINPPAEIEEKLLKITCEQGLIGSELEI